VAQNGEEIGKPEVRISVPHLFLSVLLALVSSSKLANAVPVLINVPADQPTIQQAIDAAVSGGTVLVAPGTYHELLDFRGKAITLTSAAGPATTILDGDYSGAIATLQNGEGTNTIISGFTFQRGFAPSGGAITLLGASPQILSNIFDGNWQAPTGFGAAIAGDGASPIILRNVFQANHADSQVLSGIVSFINDSSPLIAENLFLSNDFRSFSLVLTETNAPKLFNNLFRGNTVALRLMTFTNGAAPLFRNNILIENRTALLAELPEDETLPGWSHNLVCQNGVNYSGLPDQSGTNANVSADPLFVCRVQNDFHLLAGSPCIDHGDNFVTKFVRADFDGAPRNIDGNGDSAAMVDIGPFEFDPAIKRDPCIYIVCPANITIKAAAGSKFVAVDYPVPTASAGATITTSPASGALFRPGTNIVTCVATVGTNSAACSFLVIVLAVPDNDDFAAATVIDHLPYTNVQDMTLATIGPDDMFCGGLGGSVWYRITAQDDEDIYIDATASDFPVSASAYTGARGALTQIGCALGVLKINASAGQIYNVMLSPFFRATGGNLSLNVHAVPALKLQMQVNESGLFDPRTGRAIIYGKVMTTRPCRVSLAGTLAQEHGHNGGAAVTFQLTTLCPETVAWRAVVTKPLLRFEGGPARIQIAGFAFDEDAGDSADGSIQTQVRLRGAEIKQTDPGPEQQVASKPHIVSVKAKRESPPVSVLLGSRSSQDR
jgi:hypothetical protein